MPNLTIINLNLGDTQEDLINKINQNFDSIVANGGGPQGADGKQGDQGSVGQEGPIGDPGFPGERGTRWFIKDSPAPVGGTAFNSEILIGDYWVNTSASANKSVSIYATGGWTATGQFLQAPEIFTTLTGITGPSSTLKNAIVQSSSTPGSNTFVFSDKEVNINNANPTYSKFLIATDSSNGFPLLEFGKSNLMLPSAIPSDYNKHPYFGWKNPSATDYAIQFISPADSLDIISAKNLNLRSTNGDITVSGINSNLIANTSMSFTTSGLLNLNAGTSNLLINSNQFTLSASSASFTVPLSISGSPSGVSLASFVNTSTGGGISVNLTGTPSTSRFLAIFQSPPSSNASLSDFYVRSDGKIKFDKTLYAYSTNTRGGTGDYQVSSKFYNIVGPNVITNGNIAMVSFVGNGANGAGVAIPLTAGPTGFSDMIGVGESYQMNIFSSSASNTLSGVSLTTNGTTSLTAGTFTATSSVSINIVRLATSSWIVYYDTPSVSGILTA